MRFNLLLITMLLIPYVVKGQQSVVFYSEGKMHIGLGAATNPTSSNTALYVAGSMKFASSDLNPAPAVETTQRATLTGDLINALDPAHGENHLFSGTGELEFGIYLSSPWANIDPALKDPSIALTFNNSELDASLHTTTEIYPRTQRIISSYDFTTPDGLTKIKQQKRSNYLNINRIITHSHGFGSAPLRYITTYLKLDPSAAIKANELRVQRAAFFEIGTSSTPVDDPATTLIDESRKFLHTGYAQIGKYLVTEGSDVTEANILRTLAKSNFVHRVTLFEEGRPTGNDHPDGNGKYYLTGFTPLFKELGADYMYFNTLTEPGNGSITSWKGTITDASYMMTSGKGYFMASTDFKADYQEILNNTKNNFGGVTLGSGADKYSESRAKHEYVFNRLLMVSDKADPNNGLQKFNKKTTPMATYNATEEIFNTADVTVQLKAGFNYLGNPFTAPLNLGDIVNVPANAVTSLSGFNVDVSSNASANVKGIRNKYWVINKSTVRQDPTSTGWYEYNISFYDTQSAGGTNTAIDGKNGNASGEYHVAPMQMFLLQGGAQCTDAAQYSACSITLPYNKTTMNSGAISPRSAKATTVERTDEFVLEAVDLDGQTADRLAVVLRDNASPMDTDPTDTHKAVKNPENGRWYPTMDGIIYTRSSNDRPMLTNTVPTSTKQLPMYITPPTDKTRNMMIQPYRMETMSTVSRVWLEDKFENKTIELTPDTKYYFSSPVLTEDEASKNRFVIHFAPVDNEDLIVNEDPIACYYNSSTLYISGLNEKDLTSKVQIYDLQGRAVGKTEVNTIGRMEYPRPLPQGTYIVKITGKRNYTTKFVNLQN